MVSVKCQVLLRVIFCCITIQKLAIEPPALCEIEKCSEKWLRLWYSYFGWFIFLPGRKYTYRAYLGVRFGSQQYAVFSPSWNREKQRNIVSSINMCRTQLYLEIEAWPWAAIFHLCAISFATVKTWLVGLGKASQKNNTFLWALAKLKGEALAQ